MHSNKAEALSKLAAVSRELDTEIERLKDVAQHPRHEGWGKSLGALATLPFLGAGAVLVDAMDILLRRTSDGRWSDAAGDGSTAPPDEGS